jgi:predicted alpha/beta-fold hydrolase
MIGRMDPFVPRPLLRSGHAMTVYGWGAPRTFPGLPAPVERCFDPAPHTRIVAHCHWQPEPRTRPTLIALHGLNGSSQAHYMRGMAEKAFARGMNVVRLNQRNCGNTEHLSKSLFHSGLTEDVRHVMEELARADRLSSLAVAGYSLGGNLALKLAGEYGDRAPASLVAVAAVSPILEISQCVHALERKQNVLYQWNFVRDLKRRMRRKEQFNPGLFDLSRLDRIRTIREFDDVYTAPHFGFADAEDYYYKASAMRVVDRIRVPALIITSEDDPFVPPAPFGDQQITRNASITLDLCRHGGHCGFVARKNGRDDGYWAESRVIEFVALQHAASAHGQPSERSTSTMYT